MLANQQTYVELYILLNLKIEEKSLDVVKSGCLFTSTVTWDLFFLTSSSTTSKTARSRCDVVQ